MNDLTWLGRLSVGAPAIGLGLMVPTQAEGVVYTMIGGYMVGAGAAILLVGIRYLVIVPVGLLGAGVAFLLA